MSHILEEYAKSLGVLISKPIISEHYFPIPEDKYITIYSEENIQSKNYKHFNLMLDLMAPIFKKENIKVIQIDCKATPLRGINKVLGGLSFRQYANILSNSLLHIGIDNVYSHYVSSKNVPLINLFGNTYPNITNGYWSSKDKKRDIAPIWDLKPCLNMQDPKSEINKIKVEEIVQSVLDLLRINKKINFKTIRAGELFNTSIKEVVPTSFSPIPINQNEVIFLRVDKGFNPEAFTKYCENYNVSIVSNQLIELHRLEKNRHNIKKISVFLDRNSEEISENYFEILKLWGIEFQLMTEIEEDFAYLKNKYFDYYVNLYESNKQKPKNVSSKTLFLSSKRVFEGGIEYPSLFHCKIKEKSIDQVMNVSHNHEYWKEQEHFYIYEQN